MSSSSISPARLFSTFSLLVTTTFSPLSILLYLLFVFNMYTITAAATSYKPIGYQSTSTNSWEYRNISPNSPHTTPIDPSSYIGSIHYDPLHNALYITGSTYASGADTFDGNDVYNLQSELDPNNPENNAVMNGGNLNGWWIDMATGLSPHLLDLGIPNHSPDNLGDCYYAILALPPDTVSDNNDEESNKVKVIHSRRFGSEMSNEACSSIDILFSNPKDDQVGGYGYEFDHTSSSSNMYDDNEEGNDGYLDGGSGSGNTNEFTSSSSSSGGGEQEEEEVIDMNDAEYAPLSPSQKWPTEAPNNYFDNEDINYPTYNPTITSMPSPINPYPTFNPTVTSMPSDIDGFTYGDDEDFYDEDEGDDEPDEDFEDVNGINGGIDFVNNINEQPNPAPPPSFGSSSLTTMKPALPTFQQNIIAEGYGPQPQPSQTTQPPNNNINNMPSPSSPGWGNVAGLQPTNPSPTMDEPPTDEYDPNLPRRDDRALQQVMKKDDMTKNKQQQQLHNNNDRILQTDNPNIVPTIETRSVRFLISGHVEIPIDGNKGSGYIISDLQSGHYNEAQVYGFAQQVDVRLPKGDIELNEVLSDINDISNEEGGKYDELDYNLHTEAKDESTMAEELSYMDNPQTSNIPQEEYEKIVTSGVESRALLNDDRMSNMSVMYPVSLVADPTSKKHYYVVSLASEDTGLDEGQEDNSYYYDNNSVKKWMNNDETIGDGATQRSFTEYDVPNNMESNYSPHDEENNFGNNGRPTFGYNYRIIVKKMMIEGNVDVTELTDVEQELAAKSYGDDGTNMGYIAMRDDWLQEFRPDLGDDARPSGLLFAPSGDAQGMNDVLIMVGTTGGRGSAFGTSSEGGTSDTGAPPKRTDLDGFITKIRTDTGAFSGGMDFDIGTNSFQNMHSKRIASNPGRNEFVTGVCAKPLRPIGKQDEMKFVYVVGSTAGILPALTSGLRNSEFVDMYATVNDADAMEAFLMKIELETMKTVWTVQVGAVMKGMETKGDAFGFGCAVTRDGEDVYLTGLVKEGGVVTDFSNEDYQDNIGPSKYNAQGGSDVFVASYRTSDGVRHFLEQVGSTRDDFPSRGNGGITTDRLGNAIITGNTRGSLMRKRTEDEFRYGQFGEDAAMDVFIMSFDRETSNHVAVVSDGLEAPAPVPVPVPYPPTPVAPVEPQPQLDSSAGSQEDNIETEAKNGALVGAVAFSLVFIVVAVGASGVVVYRIKSMREKNALMDSSNNLRGRRQSSALPGRRSSAWGFNRGHSVAKEDFGDLNIMVEVRNSASGGWHGVYDDEQLQAIDFGVPSGDKEDVVEQSLFMDGDLQEVEDSLSQYEIGGIDDDLTDEDLIKAYNDAMALDIEPENPDVEFAMQGLGSAPIVDDEGDHRQFT